MQKCYVFFAIASLGALLFTSSVPEAQARREDRNYYPPTSPYQGYEQSEQAALPRPNSVSSGTGFFISNRGHIITNEHVVRGCSEVMIRGSVDKTTAQVVNVDTYNDLALLQTEQRPPRIAVMRDSRDAMRVGDPVMLIGYPQDRGVSGLYRVNEATIINLQGPLDEPRWIQFSDSAQQGNSGGPLLDSSGNVIGVIVGKARMVGYNEDSGEEVTLRKSDIAISLPVLKNFLHENNVYYRSRDSQAYFDTNRVENQARNYVVNIHCDQGQALLRKIQEKKQQYAN